MPAMQTMVGRLNAAFGHPNIETLRKHAELFSPGTRLSKAAAALKLVPPEVAVQRAWLRYLDAFPAGIHETLRSVIHGALTARRTVPITFAWAPAYDYEVTVWHAPDTKTSRGGITVLLRSRYPDDRHPVAR